MKKFLNNVWGRLLAAFLNYFKSDNLLKVLEEKLVKAAFKKLIISGGLKGWLVKFVIGELVEEADEHLIEPLLRNINLLKDSSDGSKVFGRIHNAETRDEWRDAAGDA